MNENTLTQIKTRLLENREKFTALLSNDIEILKLPEYLAPEKIDIKTLEDYLNFSAFEQDFFNHKQEGFYLYSTYSHLFPYVGIEFSSVYQCKVFLYFYRLSYHYAPTQEEWDVIFNDNVQLNSIIGEAINCIIN